MLIPIQDAVRQTALFIPILVALVVFTAQKKQTVALDKTTSTSLKGFAILGVLFAHIGYALVQDTRFLFPLSIAAGICLNLFLFLSGYGLTQSMMEKPLSIWTFYKRRLDKILIPFWISLILFLILDTIILNRFYPWTEIVQSFFGFFPRADLYTSLNSPLWYITFILANYLVLPLVFIRRAPMITGVLMAVIGAIATFILPLPVTEGVRDLYRIHILAFPLGIVAADLVSKKYSKISLWTEKLRLRLEKMDWCTLGVRLLLAIGLGYIFANIALNHAEIGKGWAEQTMSLLAAASLLGAFLISPFESRFLFVIGLYSFEIYLLHWPIMSRYDLFYGRVPASIATLLYLLFLLGMGYGLQTGIQKMTNRKNRRA